MRLETGWDYRSKTRLKEWTGLKERNKIKEVEWDLRYKEIKGVERD